MAEDALPENIFNILVATDIHLGYAEKDPVRGEDSFNSFEEILKTAQDNDVDLILLGGDLFHDTKPSSTCLHRCMALLREYCMGDRPISFEILSDQEKNFENASQKVVNYEDPNINVSIPVFSIHGNHDDPTGHNSICSLDILSCAGLVNFFGKSTDLNHISVSPLLLQKGESRLAIYGFGHVKDCRLYRMFDEGKVTFFRPDEYQDEWLNIGVLHQNRALNRGTKNSIPEEFLPEFLDLTIWGHEHDCRIEPEFNAAKGFYVSQPGSSVATSLASGEAIPKKVGLLKVFKKEFQMECIKLQTVRPFVFREISSSDYELKNVRRDISELLEEIAQDEVHSMINEAASQLTGHPKQPTLPLIRLRFFYDDEAHMFNAVRFGQKFEEKIANPAELLKMNKRIHTNEKRDVLEKDAMNRVLAGADVWDVRVEDYVQKYFQEVQDNETVRMNVLTVTGLNEAVTHMVDRQYNSALEEIVNYQKSRMLKHLIAKDIDVDDIDNEIRNFYELRKEAHDDEANETRTQLEKKKAAEKTAHGTGSASQAKENNNADVFMVEDDFELEEAEDKVVEEPVNKDRGRGRGRASRGPRATRAPRASRGGSRAASRAASTSSARARGRGMPQRTLQESFATQASQISVVRTSGRSNRSRMVFVESDEDD